jgi:hypothetical protein
MTTHLHSRLVWSLRSLINYLVSTPSGTVLKNKAQDNTEGPRWLEGEVRVARQPSQLPSLWGQSMNAVPVTLPCYEAQGD